jgi:hypothetical protein
MGLLKHLLFWPVTGPKFLLDFSLDKVQGVVRDELTDDSAVKAELLELQLLLEVGDIDDAEYLRREQVLMQRLREIREWREEFGMGVSGGPVRVAQAPADEAKTEADPKPADTQPAPPLAKPDEAAVDLHLDWE